MGLDERRCPKCWEHDALEKYISEDGALLWICTCEGCGYKAPILQDASIVG